MLLNRFLGHFRRQDWLAIALDFVIVVLGIFVGLQVDQWNESRKDRVLEAQYIESLKADVMTDIAQLDAAIQLAADRSRLGRVVHSAMDRRVVDIDPNEFIWAVWNTWLFNFPAYTRATYDELLSTGNLRLLRDPELKAQIAAYYTEIDNSQQWTVNWREAQTAMERTIPDLLDFYIREAGMLRYTGGPEWLSEPFEFDQAVADDILSRILEHPSAKGEIQNMTRIQDTQYTSLNRVRAKAVVLAESM